MINTEPLSLSTKSPRAPEGKPSPCSPYLSLQTLIVAFSLPQKITIHKTHISFRKKISERDLGRPRARPPRPPRRYGGAGGRRTISIPAPDGGASPMAAERGRTGRGISIASRARNLSFLAPDSNDSPRLPLPPSPPSPPPLLPPLDLWRGKWKTASSERPMMPSSPVATPSDA